MTNKEQKAVEDLRKTVEYYNEKLKTNPDIVFVSVDNFDINNLYVLLNLIQKQQEEINKLTKQNKNLDKEAQAYFESTIGDTAMEKRTIARLQEEIDKKDKIIDSMLLSLINTGDFYGKSKEEVKQYFKNKVEENNK